MYKSDLNWLPTSVLKGIDAPKIIFEDRREQNYSGYYMLGAKEIVVVIDEDASNIASTIAHELRHYIQFRTWFPIIVLDTSSFDWTNNYEKSIQKYFRSSPSELDALYFEYRVAKNDQNDWWLNKLVLTNNI